MVISDLHLGEGLGAPKPPHTLELEAALIAFLDHHLQRPLPWRLVVNGDMIEMTALAISPASVGLSDGLHPHDHQYGIGAQSESAELKIRLILEHHAPVFDAFARFLAAGHLVSIVFGNHDIELHWPSVQGVITRDLVERAVRQGGDAAVVERGFSFHPWFFFEREMAWIEHGHQYDPYCSFEEPLEPATDETEIDPNLGGLLPRYVGPRMGDSLHGSWNRGFWGYLQFWFTQGHERVVGIGQAYVDVCRRMIEHWRARIPARIEARARRAKARLGRLAERLHLPEELLNDLKGLAKAPVSVDLRRILQALMVDRLLLLLLGPLLFVLPVVLLPWDRLGYGLAAAAVPLAPWLWLAAAAREPTDPTDSMRTVARAIRERMRVPFVVMGHSHHPIEELDPTGGFLNSGHWVPTDRERAFTHVRIERTDLGVRAVLCQWRDGVSRAYGALARQPHTTG
ncbi:MAG: hypothetical protein ABMA64_05820 [Myxococcota bacterium]